MDYRRLCQGLTSPTTLISQSSTYCFSPNLSSPLGRTFLLSSNSSFSLTTSTTATATTTTTTITTQSQKKKKRTRKSLAEEQELYRIMDPSYLGRRSNIPSNSYYADPEGYWHDIDYKPFKRIPNQVQQLPTSSSTSSSSSYLSYSNNLQPHNKHSKINIHQEPLAYWETFTVDSYTTTNAISHDDDDGDGDDGILGYPYSTLTSRPCAVPSWSYYHHYPYPNSDEYGSIEIDTSINDDDDDEEGEEANERGRVSKKKKNNKTENNSDLFSSDWSSSSDIVEEEETKNLSTSQTTKPKIKSKSLSSKSEKLHRTWITTTFIARLKVIRTKRWLRERVALCTI